MIQGSFTDAVANDSHRIEVIWGDGVVGIGDGELIDASPGEFSVTRSIEPGDDIYFWSLFPILVNVYDDDTGVDAMVVTDDEGDCGCTNECAASAAMANGTQLVHAQAQQQQQQGAIKFEGIRPNPTEPEKVVTDKSVEKHNLGLNSGVGGGVLLGQATPTPASAKFVLGPENPTTKCRLRVHNVEMPINIELALNAVTTESVTGNQVTVPLNDTQKAAVKAHEQQHVDKFQEWLWYPGDEWLPTFNALLDQMMPEGRQKFALTQVLAQKIQPIMLAFLKHIETYEKVRQFLHLDHLEDHPFQVERDLNNVWQIRYKAGTYGTYLTLHDIKTNFAEFNVQGLDEATTRDQGIQIVNAHAQTIIDAYKTQLDAISNALQQKLNGN